MIKFGIISDVQYSAQEEGRNPERRPATLGIKKLTEAITELNKHDLQFIVNLGDTIDRDSTNFPAILKVFSQSRFPVWHALGNHDFYGPDYDEGYKSEALAALGMTDTTRYYYKDVGNWRFIVLDTNEVGIIENKKDSPNWISGQDYISRLEKAGKVNAKSWNGAISEDQKRWLQDVINEATKQKKECIVFAHHPIFPEHRENVLNNEEVLEMLVSHPSVKAYINGHNHDGNFGVYEGLPCWTIEGMMDYKDKTAYAIVSLDDSRLSVHGYGRVADRDIKLR